MGKRPCRSMIRPTSPHRWVAAHLTPNSGGWLPKVRPSALMCRLRRAVAVTGCSRERPWPEIGAVKTLVPPGPHGSLTVRKHTPTPDEPPVRSLGVHPPWRIHLRNPRRVRSVDAPDRRAPSDTSHLPATLTSSATSRTWPASRPEYPPGAPAVCLGPPAHPHGGFVIIPTSSV